MKNTVTFLMVLFSVLFANSQIIDPVKITKDKANNKTNQKTEEAIDKGINSVEEGIKGIFKKKEKKEKKNSKISNNKPSSEETDFTQYKSSSFVSGKDLLFFEDFSVAKTGNGQGNWFVNNWDNENPAQITKLNVSAENWLKIPRYGYFFPNSFKNLPDNCTIEFDMYINSETVSEMQSGLRFSFVAREDRENFDLHFNEKPEVTIDIHPHGTEGLLNILGTRQYGLDESKMNFLNKNFKKSWNSEEVNHVAIARNGLGIKVFVNGTEMVSVSDTFLVKGNYNFMMSSNQWGDGIYFTNLRVGTNTSNSNNDVKSGKFVTNTIYFDTNSSRIKPESWAALKQSAEAVKAFSGTVLIVGHTDSDGQDEANFILSKKRAESVKRALVQEFAIPESQLLTDGKGESQPLNNNKTSVEKAQNRRVEFIKQ